MGQWELRGVILNFHVRQINISSIGRLLTTSPAQRSAGDGDGAGASDGDGAGDGDGDGDGDGELSRIAPNKYVIALALAMAMALCVGNSQFVPIRNHL